MLILQRLLQVLSIHKKSITKAVAIVSIASLVVANIMPELSSSLPSMADEEVEALSPSTPPARYIYVDTNGSGFPPTTFNCTPRSGAYPTSVTLGGCNLDQALYTANIDTGTSTLTIVIAESLSTLTLTADPYPIYRRNGSELIIDGGRADGTKTILVGTSSMYYFFRIGTAVAQATSASALQNITIKNFAFTQLPAIGSAAITTDDKTTTSVIEGINNVYRLNIIDNYFGTTNGEDLVSVNALYQGIQLFLDNISIAPELTGGQEIHIARNNFYNTVFPIQMGTGNTSGNCASYNTNASLIDIDTNIIGTNKNGTIDTTVGGEGAWSFAAINICNLRGLNIHGNTIFNSFGLLLDTAIVLSSSQFTLQNNFIGGIIATNGTANTSPAHTITGLGVYVKGNYFDATTPPESYIVGNQINNIFTPINPALCTGRYALDEAGTSCGGTAILLEGSKNNYIYNNQLGAPNYPNQGYGIELQGSISTIDTGVGVTNIYNASAQNKIFSNIINHNKADGIHIGAIDNLTTTSSLSATACTTSLGSLSVDSNNCSNAIIQNFMYRNGAYNNSSSSFAGSSEGGIGIDLKANTDTSEQKYGATYLTGTGTTNDTDISVNVDATDADLGGNGVMNTPIINGTGSSLTSSSGYEIHGTLAENINGKYWVEVFAVGCPAENTATPVITETNAYSNCDTDSLSDDDQEEGITYGQGRSFLCGTYVNKTTLASTHAWSCKPSDFGNPAFYGLVTATATLLPDQPQTVAYGSGTTAVPPAFSSLFQGRFNCTIANVFLTNATSICPTANTAAENKVEVSLHGHEYTILKQMQSTSEFSANMYLPAPSVTITKTVRNCSSSALSSCTGAFAASVNRTPTSYVEFLIDVNNETSEDIAIDIVDTLPSQLTFLSTSCQTFNNQTATPTDNTRPSSGTACSSNITGQTLTFSPSGTGIPANRHLYIYVLASVNSSTTPGIYTNRVRAEETDYCPITPTPVCESSATVNVQRTQLVTVDKTIVSPSIDSDTHRETLPFSSTATTVNYRITATFEGLLRSDVGNFSLTDNFPLVRTGTEIAYSQCTYSISINGTTQPGSGNCDITGTITNSSTPTSIWYGSHFPDSGINDRVVVTINYRASVPNPLTAGQTPIPVVNQARWNGPHGPEAGRTSSATLILNPPVAQTPSTVDLTKTVSPTTITSSSSAQTVTYTVTLVKAAGDTLSNFAWTDTFPTTPVALTYNATSCAVTVTGGSSTGISCTSPFPDTSSANKLLNTGTLGTGITRVVVTYTATVPANAVTTARTITNNTTFSANNGAITDSSSATLTVNPAQIQSPTPTPTQTAVPVITKKVDGNNVTGTNRQLEKIFKPGDLISYTVTLLNTGLGAAANASVRDTLPSNLHTIAFDSTPTGTTGSISSQVLTVPGITIPTGSTGVAIRYHGSINAKANFDLDAFNLNESTNPARDDDFYIPKDAEPDMDISSTNNGHRRAKDILGVPDGKYISLGKEGSVIIDLGDKVIVDTSGSDFSVLELDIGAIDDNDKTTEQYDVSVSQDGNTYKAITADNTDSAQFDLKKARLTWARFIKLEDSSSAVKAQAPGADIDAICLLHIGVQVPNRAELTYNGTTVRASDTAVVDITSVFKKKPSSDNCQETEPTPVTPLSPPPLPVAPPAPPAPVITPPPPKLPKTGPAAIGILGIIATLATIIARRKR